MAVLKTSRISGVSILHSISEIPKRPITTTTKSKPSTSFDKPKVNRCAPKTGSIPTVPSRRPATHIMRPLITDSSERYTAISNPRMTNEKYSGVPNLSANAASEGATIDTPKRLMVPAIKDPMADMPRARPALPFRAI
ncbi:MAG: hypothetical protein ACD_74C00054G0001 [uncultured bacterium]|nr:MAG: hypothetical protein ACD_74C00054G0001 [uncultured bacterium]